MKFFVFASSSDISGLEWPQLSAIVRNKDKWTYVLLPHNLNALQ